MDLSNRMIQYLKASNNAFSTIKTYKNVLELILKTHSDFENYKDAQLVSIMNDVPDPVTRGNYRNVILKVHRDMLGKKINIPFIKRPERLQGIYSMDEIKKISANLTNKKHRAIYSLIFTEGFRISEVISIRKIDCNKANASITIRGTKDKSDYIKYLDQSTLANIREYLLSLKINEIPVTYLFEGQHRGEQYTARSAQKFMTDAIKRAGLPKKGSCHIFRRSSSVFKIESGWSLQHIAVSLNNTPKTVAKYYALVRPDYLKTLPKPAI